MHKHISVLTKPLLENFRQTEPKVIVDATLGAGGHTLAIAQEVQPKKLIAFEVDQYAWQKFATERKAKLFSEDIYELKAETELLLVNRNFDQLAATLRELGVTSIDGLVADLGWASEQLQSIPGLAYSSESNLDMRLDRNLQVRASDLLNGLYKQELAKLFTLGTDLQKKEIRNLLTNILNFRKNQLFTTTTDLNQVISQTFGKQEQVGGKRAQVYQALRIAVNSELPSLQSLLEQTWELIKPGGVVQVITFHSGEEKVVKTFYQNYGLVEVVRPTVAELRQNLRARSAKLWVLRK